MIKHQAKWLLVGLMCLPLWPGLTHGQSAVVRDAYNRSLELRAEGRYQEAIPFAETAVRFGQEEFGPDHPNTATLLNDLAELYRVQGLYAEAEPLHQRSLAIFEKALGLDHPYMVKTLTNLAKLCEELGKGEEAAILSAQAKAMQERLVGR